MRVIKTGSCPCCNLVSATSTVHVNGSRVVASGALAEKAGLKTGDIIDLADGAEVETSSALEKLIAMTPPAQSCGCA